MQQLHDLILYDNTKENNYGHENKLHNVNTHLIHYNINYAEIT